MPVGSELPALPHGQGRVFWSGTGSPQMLMEYRTLEVELNSSLSHRPERHEILYQDVRICSVVSIQGGDSSHGEHRLTTSVVQNCGTHPTWIDMSVQFTWTSVESWGATSSSSLTSFACVMSKRSFRGATAWPMYYGAKILVNFFQTHAVKIMYEVIMQMTECC
ncbi:hypothetical protein ACE6H2_001328 [Prunus campanulata]